MATKDEKRQKFIALPHALFQLDQPDLDFGFYRIMHAKAGQVTKFLEEDLLGIIQEAFGEADEACIAEARASYEAARKQAEDFGAPDPSCRHLFGRKAPVEGGGHLETSGSSTRNDEEPKYKRPRAGAFCIWRRGRD